MSPSKSLVAESARVLVPIAIVGVGVASFLVFGARPEARTEDFQRDRAALVETRSVEEFQGKITIDADGVAIPYKQVKLAAEVDGKITFRSPKCRGGKFVEQSTELIEIDPTDYELEVRRLTSQLQRATEELASVEVDIANTNELIALAEENLGLWRRELERNERLSAKSTITEAALDEVRRQELSGRNTLQTHKNQLIALGKSKNMLEAARDMIGVDLEKSQKILTRTQIVAPVTGTVVTAYVEEGDYVRKGDALVDISVTSPMEVRFNLRIDQLYWIWLTGHYPDDRQPDAATSLAVAEATWEIPQMPVEVAYRLGGMKVTWAGHLARYEGTGLDEQTRTIPCRALVTDPVGLVAWDPATEGASRGPGGKSQTELPPVLLFAGLYVDLRVPVDPPFALLSIPEAALRAGDQVWVVRGNRLNVHTVDVARIDKDRVLIRADGSSIQSGDRVVTSPMAAVQNNMPVRVNEQIKPPETGEPPINGA